MNMRKAISTLLAILLLGCMATAMAATEVTMSGSTTVMPLGEALAEAFNSEQSDYHVSVTGGGTGAGVTAIAEGRSDIAMASREITSDEKTKYGDKFQENMIGYDGIAIAVSQAVYDGGVKALTKDQVKQIYDGEITNWKEVGGPDEDIYVLAREAGSGTLDTFNEIIMGDKAAETPGVTTNANSNAEVKTAITGSDKAIGYLGHSYAESGALKAVTLDGIDPTVDNIKNGKYELARKLYLYTFEEPSAGAKDFIDYAVSADGQKVAEENGFIPI
jgi:phosphate transport system substrate-binding protein